jgi:hypothetical protein
MGRFSGQGEFTREIGLSTVPQEPLDFAGEHLLPHLAVTLGQGLPGNV